MSLKKELEKHCFKIPFSKIKSHVLLKNLELKEEEIINNWRIIKKFLDCQNACGESQKFCNSLDCHYCIKRNLDQKLILQEISCNKIKNFPEISGKKINEKIQELTHGSSFSFNHSEIPSCVRKLQTLNKPEINELIKNLGDPKYSVANTYVKIDKGKKEICILLTYHLILSGKPVIIIKSNDLKELCVNNSYQFKSEETEKYSHKFQRIKNINNLIILDLGLENENLKHTYYLDLFPDFINQRKNKTTYIISPIHINLITEELKNSKKKTSLNIHVQKINELNNIMESFFSEMT